MQEQSSNYDNVSSFRSQEILCNVSLPTTIQPEELSRSRRRRMRVFGKRCGHRLEHLVCTGFVEIVMGVACIAFNSVSLGISGGDAGMAFVGHGFWCGMLFIVTGSFGVATAFLNRNFTSIGFLCLSIMSAFCTVFLLSLGIIGAVTAEEQSHDCNNNSYGFSPHYPYFYRPPCSKMHGYDAIVAMEAGMAAMGLLMCAFSIWGAIISCQAKGCHCFNTTPMADESDEYNADDNGTIVNADQLRPFDFVPSPPPYEEAPPAYSLQYTNFAYEDPPTFVRAPTSNVCSDIENNNNVLAYPSNQDNP